MKVLQCDGCQRVAPTEAPGWYVLSQREDGDEEAHTYRALFGGSVSYKATGTFCGLRCVADYATVALLLDSVEGQPP